MVFACFAVVCATALAGLVLVLRHLATMRVTTSEVATLRNEWTTGSKAIAEAQKALDDKLTTQSDAFQRLLNRIGK